MSGPGFEPDEHDTARVVAEQTALIHSVRRAFSDSAEEARARRDRARGHHHPRPPDLCWDVLEDVVGVVRKLAGGTCALVGSVASAIVETITDPCGWCATVGGSAAMALHPTFPGGTSSAKLSVKNPTHNWFDHIQPTCVALVGEGSRLIRGEHIVFHPHVVNVAPHASAKVQVTVVVPEDTPLGSYIAAVTIPGYPAVHMLLMLDVVPFC